MANASPRDTRAGFDIYRSADGNVSLDDLNAQLVEAGYGPVAPRTYRHYQSLVEAGYNRYVSINRFDVARAAAPFESTSASGRYSYLATDLGVRVIFAKSNKLLETFGRATEVGEVGAMLRFDEPAVVEGLRKLKPQPGDMVTVRYLEVGRTAGGRVVEADVKSEPASIEIEYASLISIAEMEAGTPLPASEARFLLRGPGDDLQTLEVAGRRLYHFFELIEGVRALSNGAGRQQRAPVYAEPAVLKRLSVASPAEFVIVVAEQIPALFPWAVAVGLLKAAASLPEKRKQWYEGTGLKHDSEIKKQAVREKQLATELKELEAARVREEAGLRQAILGRLRETFPESSIDDTQAGRIIDEYILPPLRALARAGIRHFIPPDPDTSQRSGE